MYVKNIFQTDSVHKTVHKSVHMTIQLKHTIEREPSLKNTKQRSLQNKLIY